MEKLLSGERRGMGTVHIEVRDGVAVLTLDNPPLNVLSTDMGRQIKQAVETIGDNPAVYAVVVTGAGDRAFMAGADIKEFPQYIEEGNAEEKALAFDDAMNQLQRLGKPTIAALNGLTLGGGCELALACDFRIAEEQIVIGLPEIKLGVFPGAGGTQRLSRLIGPSRAKELIFSGEPVSAAEAYRIGLVNRVVHKGSALSSALEFAQVFTQRSQVALRLAKQAMDQGLEIPLEDGIRLEAKLFGEVFRSADAKEGIQAFIEKRQPKFTNR
jgi:enoyl-CoA hydratase